MRLFSRTLLLVVCLAALAAQVHAADDVRVQTSVSRTALFVGSVARYRVILACRPGVDILQEDLSADRLSLTGLQVVNQSVARDVPNDGSTRYVVDFDLTTFEPGGEELRIGDWTVRYAAATSTRGTSPAQEMQIPGAVLVWRSALPSMPATLDLRQDRSTAVAPGLWNRARAGGIALVIVALLAIAWLVLDVRGAARPRRAKRRVPRGAARDLRNMLEALRDRDVSSPSARLAAYEALETALRQHLSQVADLPAASLTAGEVRDRLSTLSAAADLSRVLAECEQARYAPPTRLPGEEQFRATADAAMAIFPA